MILLSDYAHLVPMPPEHVRLPLGAIFLKLPKQYVIEWLDEQGWVKDQDYSYGNQDYSYGNVLNEFVMAFHCSTKATLFKLRWA